MAAGDGGGKGKGRKGGAKSTEACANTYGDGKVCDDPPTVHAGGSGACFAAKDDNAPSRFCGCPGYVTASIRDALDAAADREQDAKDAMQDGGPYDEVLVGGSMATGDEAREES